MVYESRVPPEVSRNRVDLPATSCAVMNAAIFDFKPELNAARFASASPSLQRMAAAERVRALARGARLSASRARRAGGY
jgi:hypothetical protein